LNKVLGLWRRIFLTIPARPATVASLTKLAAVTLLLLSGCGPAPQSASPSQEERPRSEARDEGRHEERTERKRERREERREAQRQGRDSDEARSERSEHRGERGPEERGAEERSERNDRLPPGLAPDGGSLGGAASGTVGGGYDLQRDEQLGGHTLRKHVGRTDEQLRERLANEPNISAASTWTTAELAEQTVGAALRDQAGRISQWESRSERRANLALHYDAGREIGRSLPRNAPQTVPCSSAVIVLKASGGGFFVLTTYPEASR
jgi:hypothetical protein